VDGEEPIELVSVGLRSPLTVTFGYKVLPDCLLSEVNLDDFDALAVPGGFEPAGFYSDAFDPAFLDVIRHFENAGKAVASVCVASLALGKAGVIKNRRATVYHQVGGTRKAQLESYGANFEDKALVKDGNLITSSGPGTGIEVAFQLLTDLTSEANTKHIRALMRIAEPTEAWRNTPQVKEE